MQQIIKIYPCLLKLSRKQESVTDRQTGYYYIPSPLSRGDKKPSCTCPEKSVINFCQTICPTDLNISNQNPETEFTGKVKDIIKCEK